MTLLAAVLVVTFLCLCVWQVGRALGGNTLSWAYVFEWPLFAGYVIYMWWRLRHEDDPPGPGGDADPVALRRRQQEDEAMAEYNRYLAQLAADDEADRP